MNRNGPSLLYTLLSASFKSLNELVIGNFADMFTFLARIIIVQVIKYSK